MLKMSQHLEDDITVIRLVGNLDAASAASLREDTEEFAGARHPRIVIDLSDLILIDSSGVGALVAVYKRVRATGGELRIAGLRAQPAQVFKILGLTRVIAVFPSVAEGIASFHENPSFHETSGDGGRP